MRKKSVVLLVCLAALVFFCAARDRIIKEVMAAGISSVTGAPVEIGGLSLSIVKQTAVISDFKMYNPQGFSRDVLVDIPRIKVSCDAGALLKGKIYLKRLDIDLKEVGLAKNQQGELNVDSLKIVKDQKKTAGKEETKPANEMAIRIDVLNLSMGRVVNRDYSGRSAPVIKVYELDLVKTYKNITSVQQLAALIIAQTLKSAGIRGAAIYGLSALSGGAVLPVAAVVALVSKDSAEVDLDVPLSKAYNTGLKVLGKSGGAIKENKARGVISAQVNGAIVTVKFKEINRDSTHVTVSARKFLLPQPQISSGVLYQICNER